MSQIVLKIVIFILVAALGFSMIALYTNAMIFFGILPRLDDASMSLFTHKMFNGAIWFWIAGVCSGLFYFWLKSAFRLVFLWLPVIMTLGFCIFFTMGNA